MRVRFSQDGGFAAIPGLQRSVELDTDSLDPGAAEELVRLVESSRFFEQPESIGTTGDVGADKRTYTLSVEDHDRSRTIRLQDPIPDANLAALIRFAQRRG